MGRSWSRGEEAAALASADHAGFLERTPAPEEGRTFDAWRVKRGKLIWEEGPVTRVRRAEPPLVAAVKGLNPERYAIDPDPDDPTAMRSGSPADYDRYFDLLERAAEARTALSSSVKAVAWRAPVSGPVGIAFIGDIHAGANIDYLRFRQVLDTVARTDGLYAVCTGDLTENSKATLKSGNALYTAVFANPREQMEYIKRRMAICRGKWLAIAGGNHDSFDFRTAGVDRLPDLCEWLGAPYMTEAGGTVTAEVGGQRYVMAVKHDWRGKSQINKTNSQRRMWDEWPEWENCDVVAVAHLHEPIMHSEQRKGRTVHYMRNGTFKVRDEWAESNGYRPAFGVPVVILYPDGHKIVPFDGPLFDDAVDYLTSVRRSAR